MKESRVVTCFLRHRGDVLLLRRSHEVGSYRGRWGAVAGYVEGTPDDSALREIAEETGLEDRVRPVERGEPFTVEDEALDTRWLVHPYLFDCDSRDVRLDWESTEAAWVSPTEIRRRETVPELWTSYEHVAPTIASVREDRKHGSTYLSLRALEILRDRASDPGVRFEALADLGRALLNARPSMAVIANRVNRAMHRAGGDPRVLEEVAHAGIAAALEADASAARRAGELVSGKRVLTLSRSETVTAALLEAGPPFVAVAESQPGGEGVQVANLLKAAGLDAVVVPDATLEQTVVELEVNVMLVGADALLPSGAVVNKVGTQPAARAARDEGIPVYVVSAEDKVALDESIELEPIFDVTPPDLVTGIVTEHGVLDPAAVPGVARKLARLSDWQVDG